MRDGEADRMDQEGPGGLPAQGEEGGAAPEDPREDGPASVAHPDLVADTVGALQARIQDGDRDVLRGTIGPASPPAPGGADHLP